MVKNNFQIIQKLLSKVKKFRNDLFSLPLWFLEFLLINNNQFYKHLFFFAMFFIFILDIL